MTASQDMIRGRSNIITLTNNSGGALVAGDVCVQDATGDEYATTTTSAASVLKVFVAAESIAAAATGKFYESGYCPLVNVNASVTRGRFLFTHTVAKQAAENATYGAGAFGKILKSGTTPSALIYSATAQVSGLGSFVQLSQTVLGSNASTISFGTISGSYTSLRLALQGRGTQAATEVDVLLQFNADTAGNYDRDFLVAYNSVTLSTQAVSQTSIFVGGMVAASGPADAASQIDISIDSYAKTTFHKTLSFQCAHKVGATAPDMRHITGTGHWKSTAAITGIVLSVSAGQFATGTVATLYGLT